MTDTNAVATIANKPPIVVLRERLESRKAELKSALVDIEPDVFIRAVMTSAQINPDILACTFQSIWTACMRACRDGLLPDGVEAAIVGYKDKATYIPMYQGLLRNFRRSGQFKWITAGLIRDGEEFKHYIDEQGEHFRHVPGDDIGATIQKIYAMATTKDGGVFIAVLPLAEANKMRNMSRATREDAPWKIWPEEMYKKTALRRLAKLLPTARDRIGGFGSDSEDEPPDADVPTMIDGGRRESGAAAALAQFAGDPQQATPVADNSAPASPPDDSMTPDIDQAEAGAISMTELDGKLEAAAEQGEKQLRMEWEGLSRAEQKTLKVAYDRRHKPRAAEVDLAKESPRS
jgi:phage RecT family recombinase